MTHIENIPHILNNGITHQNSLNSNKDYKPIGYQSLISKRDSFLLPNDKILGTYIPFYFGARMPMLYVIMLGNNSVKYNLEPISPDDIIYCITSVEKILEHKLSYVFSDGHAVSELTTFYDEAHHERIDNIIDYKAINAIYWVDENDLDLKRRKEAEFLIENDIPADAILGFAVRNVQAKEKLLSCGIPEKAIVIKPQYYF